MAGFIVSIIVGVVCIVLGISNMRGNISSLHAYHRAKVSEEDRIPFGKRVGLGAVVENNELRLEFFTDQPGVQFYIANFLGGKPDLAGGIQRIKHGGFCLEAQTEPNCIKHGEAFYDAGEKYMQTTVYRISRKI